jgi:two-component system response regulator PilR (NtrC family)
MSGDKAMLAPAALDALRAHSYPGNVRELENILERALAFASNGVIEVADLALKPGSAVPVEPAGSPASPAAVAVPSLQTAAPSTMPAGDLPSSLPDHLDDVEREIIRRALAKTHFNRTQAAELLGISFRQLRYRMQRLSIQEPD